MERLRRLFWFSGRASRREYWFVGLPANIALIAPFVLLAQYTTGTPGGELAVQLDISTAKPLVPFALLLAAAALVLNLALIARRLHDRGKSAWWLLMFNLAPIALLQLLGAIGSGGGHEGTVALLMIPVYGMFFWALVELGFLRGTVGRNRYGDDPLNPVLVEVFS